MGCDQFRFLSEDELYLVSGGLTAEDEAEREALRRAAEQNRPTEQTTTTGYKSSFPPSDGNHISYTQYATMMQGSATGSLTVGYGGSGASGSYTKSTGIPPMSDYLNYMNGAKRTDTGCQTCHH
jgi:hypothetical protein